MHTYKSQIHLNVNTLLTHTDLFVFTVQNNTFPYLFSAFDVQFVKIESV